MTELKPAGGGGTVSQQSNRQGGRFEPWAGRRKAKRALDVVVASAALVVASPIALAAAVAIRIRMGRPVFFKHVRPGRFAEPFTMFKFRTMTQPKPGEDWLRTDQVRLTGLGRALRKTSVDEIPSLWNVVRGDMSIVGPRPLLMEYVPRYTELQAHRMDVRPGITGWAQVNGRQDIPLSKRIELDLWYVEHQTIGLDIRIIYLTLKQAIVGSGVRSGQDPAEIDDLGRARG